MMKVQGLDLASLSLDFNTDEMTNPPMNEVGFMLGRAHRVLREVGIPVTMNWNLDVPAHADRTIREELLVLVFLRRPAVADPHWLRLGGPRAAT